MEKLFKLKQYGTTPGREVVAGLTTFFAMAYIIVVNPTLLSQSGLDGALFVPILKIIAISMVARLGGDVCRDSGKKALGAVVDLAGTFCALLAAEPLLRAALSLLTQLGGMG